MEPLVSFSSIYWNVRSSSCSFVHSKCCGHACPILLLCEPANSSRIVPRNSALARQLSRLFSSIHNAIPVAEFPQPVSQQSFTSEYTTPGSGRALYMVAAMARQNRVIHSLPPDNADRINHRQGI